MGDSLEVFLNFPGAIGLFLIPLPFDFVAHLGL